MMHPPPESSLSINHPPGIEPRFVALIAAISPIFPLSIISFVRVTEGSYLTGNVTISFTSFFLHSSIIFLASSIVVAIGFSTITCFFSLAA